MHWVVTGLALSLSTAMSSPQVSQMPKVPSSIRSRVDLIFFDQLVFAISNAKHKIPIGFEGCPIGGVGKIFFMVGHPGYGVVRVAQQFLQALG
jgi:hypothetical protein